MWDDRAPHRAPDALGWNALHHACAVGWREGAALAIAGGVALDALTLDGVSALDLAVQSGQAELVDALLACEPVVEAEKQRAYSTAPIAARRAVERGDLAIFDALKARGVPAYGADLAIRLVRALVLAQTGREVFVLKAGEEVQFEPLVPEVLGFEGEVRIDPAVARCFALALTERDGRLERVELERFELLRAARPEPPVRSALLPDPVARVTEPVQAWLHGEATPDLLRPFESLCQLGAVEVVRELAHGVVPFWLSGADNAFVRGVRHPDIVAILLDALPADAIGLPAIAESVRETVRRGSLAVAAPMIRRGLDPNAGGGFLSAAISARKPEHVLPLVELGAAPDAILGDARGPTTALVQAVHAGQPSLVEALLRAGADANLAADPARIETSPLGALSRARVYDLQHRRPIFDLLIAAGADVNQRDARGRTALHVERYTDVMQWLVEAGASLEAQDDEGYTPVQRVMFDSFPVAMGLLRYGRGLDQRDREGNTLVHLACFSAWPGVEIFEKLRELGLDLEATNHQGLTPLERAMTERSPQSPGSGASREKAIAALRSLVAG